MLGCLALVVGFRTSSNLAAAYGVAVTLTMLITNFLFYFAARYFSRLIKHASREKRRRSGSLSAVTEESLANASLIQAYNRQDAEVARRLQEAAGVGGPQVEVGRRPERGHAPDVRVVRVSAPLAKVRSVVLPEAERRLAPVERQRYQTPPVTWSTQPSPSTSMATPPTSEAWFRPSTCRTHVSAV